MEDKEPTVLTITQKYEKDTLMFAHLPACMVPCLVPVRVIGINDVRFLGGFKFVTYNVVQIYQDGSNAAINVKEEDLYTEQEIGQFLKRGV